MSSLFIPQNILSNTATLVGEYALKRSDTALMTNIRNLSSGLRIHSGRDDPSGFVSSSILGTEIASLAQAVTNCKAADNICSATDSALSQINDILLDIRGMVSEAANTGTMNTAMLEALQLQLDASLDTIDRIASSAYFMDQKLLDGSLDFVTYGLDEAKADFLQINQASFLGQIEKDIPVKILQQARQAALFYRQTGISQDVHLSVGGNLGYTTIPVSQGASLQSIVEAVNLVSDSTGIEAKLETRATNGTIAVSSVGEDNDIILTASQSGTLYGNFVIKYTAPREGNDTLRLQYTPGSGNIPNQIEVILQTNPAEGTQPPEVLTTAEQVASLINTSDQLRDDAGNGLVVASFPDRSCGVGIVTPFEDFAYYGNVETGNALQFLGTKNSPDIAFVSQPGQALSIGYSEPPIYDFAQAAVQGLDVGTSFTLKTIAQTSDYDGYTVRFVDSTESSDSESVTIDDANSSIVFRIDFADRLNDPSREPINMQELQTLFDESEAGKVFHFVPLQTYEPSTPPKFENSEYVGINAAMGEVEGGLVDSGTLTVFLETGEDGLVKTTANDLMTYFEHPASVEETSLIQKLGISVSGVYNSSGCGILAPTYDPEKCEISNGYPIIHFNSSYHYGSTNNVNNEPWPPAATIVSGGGQNAVFTISAKQGDSPFLNCDIRVVNSENGLTVSYDATSNQLAIGIDPYHPPTAQEVVDLINLDEQWSKILTASIPSSVPGSGIPPDGTGRLQLGDGGVMRGDISETAMGAPMLCASDAAAVGIIFYSTDFGGAAFVDVKTMLPNESFPTVNRYGGVTERAIGGDVIAEINGQLAAGNGRTASISTTELDMAITINSDVRDGEVIGFRITGGGALMQLGPDIDPSEQVRIAFQSMYTANIGGQSGKLTELYHGNGKDLLTNTKGAYHIVEESILQVSFLRGRIGSFQKYAVANSRQQMTDLIEIASSTNSEIRETDYAVETSNLAKNQLMLDATTQIIRSPTENMRLLVQLLSR
jgi:flagellin-like hook-associated protein FlgL